MRLIIIFLCVAFLSACHDDCPGGVCDCGDRDRCEVECGHVPCDVMCASVDECEVGCGDACSFECTSASSCALGCGDACQVDCHSVSDCDVDCAEGCEVRCASLASCRVLMNTGFARCESVGSCEIRCRTLEGTSDALDCGDGVYACGSCPT